MGIEPSHRAVSSVWAISLRYLGRQTFRNEAAQSDFQIVGGLRAGLRSTAYPFSSSGPYALMCELYIFLFTLVLSSVSATVLIMLRRGPVRPPLRDRER